MKKTRSKKSRETVPLIYTRRSTLAPELLILFNIVVLQHDHHHIWDWYLAIDYSIAIISLLTTISLMIGLGSDYRA